MNERITCLLLALLLASGLHAAVWSDDPYTNNEVCPVAGYQALAAICTDGGGGYLLVWHDERDGGGAANDLYMQHYDVQGHRLWPVDGLLVLADGGAMSDLSLCTDTAGGAYVAVTAYVGGQQRVVVQHVTADGSLPWGTSGLLVTPDVSGSPQRDVAITPDGFGGAILVWTDYRNSAVSGADLWAQRVSPSGLAWSGSGMNVCNRPGDQFHVVMDACPGGVVLAWQDERELAIHQIDVYAQRLDGGGTRQWTFTGVPVCTVPQHQYVRDIASDGSGGAWLVWEDLRFLGVTNYDIYAQHLDDAGVPQGTVGGEAVCSADGAQKDPHLVPDGGGGVYVAWTDGRADGYDQYSIYAQRLAGNVQSLWNSDGVVITPVAAWQYLPVLGTANDGDLLVAWSDDRNGHWDIFAQRVSPTADLQWGGTGLLVSGAALDQVGPRLASVVDGSFLCTWSDDRNGTHVFVQRVDGCGFAGYPDAVITAVTDVPADQGGEVHVTWNRSPLDDGASGCVQRYDLWRRPVSGGEDWVLVLSVTPDGSAQYTVTAPTTADSTAADPALMEFQVVSIGVNGQWWASENAIGYSVDNLPPGPPVDLTATLVAGDAHLAWTASGVNDDDLYVYRIYRGDTPAVPTDPGHQVGVTAQTTYVESPLPQGEWYYVVTGVDIHGNEGLPSDPAHITTPTGVGEPPAVLTLREGRPNPFNPRVEIRFTLPAAGRCRVAILDAAGRRVRVLVDTDLPAGDHAVAWDGRDATGRTCPAGVYLCRLTAGGEHRQRRLTLVR